MLTHRPSRHGTHPSRPLHAGRDGAFLRRTDVGHRHALCLSGCCMHGAFAPMSKRITRVVAAALLTAALACTAVVSAYGQQRNFDGAEWPMAGKDYAGTRFSELSQITAANVGSL